jgi:protein-S-isoprenylcysteine O-methyltransferase Ste14
VSAWRHALAILLLPFTATVLVPVALVRDYDLGGLPLRVAGVLSVALGLWLFVTTVALFARLGRGTLAPWDSTTRLVVAGPYRRVRNPMISGVLFVLLGEAAILAAPELLAWAGIFLAVNAVWMPLVEEPGLRRRFGGAYEEYAAHVPRWLPRPTPWSPTAEAGRSGPRRAGGPR